MSAVFFCATARSSAWARAVRSVAKASASARSNGTSSSSGVPSKRVHESRLSYSTASKPFSAQPSIICWTQSAARRRLAWCADVDQVLAAPVRIVAELVEDECPRPVRLLVGAVDAGLVRLGLEGVHVTDRVGGRGRIRAAEPVTRDDRDVRRERVVPADLVVEAGVDGRRSEGRGPGARGVAVGRRDRNAAGTRRDHGEREECGSEAHQPDDRASAPLMPPPAQPTDQR